jgi:hypothetical protein
MNEKLIDLNSADCAVIVSVAPYHFSHVVVKTTLAPISDDPDEKVGRMVYRHVYRMKPPEKQGLYSTCKVYEAVEFATAYNEEGKQVLQDPLPTRAHDLASYIASVWAGGGPTSGGKGMGIAVLPPGEKVPTQEFLNNLRKQHQQHMEESVKYADQQFKGGNVQFITKRHIEFANLINYVSEWTSQGEMQKSCPFCARPMALTAAGCGSCGTDLIEFYEKDGHTPDSVKMFDPHVAQRWQERLDRVAKKAAGAVKGPAPVKG